MQKFAVIGLGRFGTTLSIKLSEQGAEVMAIDKDESIIESLKDDVAYPIALDATDIKSLEAQNISEFDACIVAIGSDFESLLLATVNLMKLDVNTIVARAMNQTQKTILERLGVKKIILPEVEVASNLAENLIQPELKSFIKLADDYEIAEIKASGKIAGKTLRELDLRKKYELNVVAIERLVSTEPNEQKKEDDEKSEEEKSPEKERRKILGITDPGVEIKEDDTLIVIGKQEKLKKFIDLQIE